MSHEAILQRRGSPGARPFVKVIHADPTIWIAPELLAEAAPPGEAPIIGGLERDGDLIRFGTEGEGLGRLTYRLVGEHYEYGQFKVHVAQLVRSDDELPREDT